MLLFYQISPLSYFILPIIFSLAISLNMYLIKKSKLTHQSNLMNLLKEGLMKKIF